MGGVDKGLQMLRGRPMVAWVLERLAPQVGEIVINANQNLEAYAQFGHRVVPDAIGGRPAVHTEEGMAQCLSFKLPDIGTYEGITFAVVANTGITDRGAETLIGAALRSNGDLDWLGSSGSDDMRRWVSRMEHGSTCFPKPHVQSRAADMGRFK